MGGTVKPGTTEPRRFLAGREERVVNEGDDAGRQGDGGTGAGDDTKGVVLDVGEVLALGCEIRVASAVCDWRVSKCVLKEEGLFRAKTIDMRSNY
jgi:hypothetical protein